MLRRRLVRRLASKLFRYECGKWGRSTAISPSPWNANQHAKDANGPAIEQEHEEYGRGWGITGGIEHHGIIKEASGV